MGIDAVDIPKVKEAQQLRRDLCIYAIKNSATAPESEKRILRQHLNYCDLFIDWYPELCRFYVITAEYIERYDQHIERLKDLADDVA